MIFSRPSLLVAPALLVATLIACGSESSSSGDQGPTAGAPGSGEASTNAAVVATPPERCTRLCKNWDGRAVGAGSLSCGPDVFLNAPGNYECKDLCEEFVSSFPLNDDIPDDPGICLQRFRAFVDCAFPCQDPFDVTCFQQTCAGIEKCAPAALTEACRAPYGRYLEKHGISADAGPTKSATAECNRLCAKRETAGCPQSNCALGCSLYTQTSTACQTAELTLAGCQDAAPDVCTASCGAEIQAMGSACR